MYSIKFSERIDADWITYEELDGIMYCVNNGASFKPFQKMRIVLGSAIMEEIQPVCDSVFWEKAENITAKNDNILGCVIRSLILLTALQERRE